MRLFSFTTALVIAALGFMYATPAQAAVLAYEGFDYPADDTIVGKTGGTGWGSNAWTTTGGDGPDVVVSGSLVSTNVTYNSASTGNHGQVGPGRRVARFLDTSVGGVFDSVGFLNGAGDIGVDGTTLYLSFMIQETVGNADGYYELVFNRNDLGDGGRIGGIGDDQAGANINLRTGGTHTSIIPRDTGVHLFVVKFDFLSGNDRVSVYADPTGSSEPGVPTTQVTLSDMSFDGLSFAAFVGDTVNKVDEIRIATTFAEAVGVPEPSTVALSFLAIGVAVARRSRRTA